MSVLETDVAFDMKSIDAHYQKFDNSRDKRRDCRALDSERGKTEITEDESVVSEYIERDRDQRRYEADIQLKI